MQISKELLEKYHDGMCSAEEKKAVEDWLFSDESTDELALPAGGDKLAMQHEMWAEIASVLPEKGQNRIRPLWRQVAASAAVFVLVGSGWYFLQKSGSQDIIKLNNTSETVNKNVQSNDFSISVGPKSNVEINSETGVIDFCGAMMINPKEDIEFTIQGTCENPTDNKEKVILKKGLNYYALNYSSNANSNEVIVLEEGAVMSLPPLVMKQLLHQFDI